MESTKNDGGLVDRCGRMETSLIVDGDSDCSPCESPSSWSNDHPVRLSNPLAACTLDVL